MKKNYVKPIVVAEMKARKTNVTKNNKKDVFSAAWKNGCAPLVF